MGWFQKDLKNKCRVCGMNEVSGGVCTYCGQPAQQGITAADRALDNFKRPHFIVRSTKQRNSRSSEKLEKIHKHSNQHQIVTPKSEKLAKYKQDLANKRAQASQNVERLKSQQKDKAAASQKGTGISKFFFLVVLIAWGFCFAMIIESFESHNGKVPELGIEGAALLGVFGFLLVVFARGRSFRTFICLILIPLTSLILLTKPLVNPIKYAYSGQSHALSYTSETHMYFVMPGAFLLFVTVVLGFKTIGRLFKWAFG